MVGAWSAWAWHTGGMVLQGAGVKLVVGGLVSGVDQTTAAAERGTLSSSSSPQQGRGLRGLLLGQQSFGRKTQACSFSRLMGRRSTELLERSFPSMAP